ncbi:MAG TPA: hypothetical protein VN808_17185 [Stellaceae bacterium]|nr:hypothetical protein [Stellaceae bacterium]
MAGTQQLLLHLPDQLVRRLRRAVPARQRSKFIQDLLEQALPPDGAVETDPLYLAALSVEADEALAAEMVEWEPATIADGVAVPSGGGASD